MHWLLHVLGIDTQQSYWYDAWSGCIPAILTSTTIAAAAWALIRRHQCHVRSCWRIGRQQVDGTTFVVCRRHHPDGAPAHRHVLKAAQTKGGFR